MDGSGNMTVSGIVYIDNGGSLNMLKSGSDKTITYTGSGAILTGRQCSDQHQPAHKRKQFFSHQHPRYHDAQYDRLQ